jgi:serine/threonine-protein kinase
MDTVAPSVPAPAESSAWLQQDRYMLERLIAQGGMGCVYRVYDRELDREVALKVLRPEVATDPMFVASLIAEARAVGQLEHPSIMPIYDLGMTASSELYFTMKYIAGETLTALIGRLRTGDAEAHAAYPFSARVDIAVKLAEALAYAHGHGVLHRDITPGNVMIGPFGEVTLMDWGLARTTQGGPARPAHSSATAITRLATGATLADVAAGTPGYIAPEVLLNSDEYNERSEVYSLGVVLYELFTLQSPYRTAHPEDLLSLPLLQDPIPADEVLTPVQGRVPKEIALVLSQAMARDPQLRYLGPNALSYALEQYRRGEAPVVCVHTGLKRAVYSFARVVDQHGHLVIVILAILLATPILMALLWWLTRHIDANIHPALQPRKTVRDSVTHSRERFGTVADGLGIGHSTAWSSSTEAPPNRLGQPV